MAAVPSPAPQLTCNDLLQLKPSLQAERNGPRGRRQRSVRHCISSRPADVEALLALVHGHWGAGTRPPSWPSCAGPP